MEAIKRIMSYKDTSELISGASLALFRTFGIQKVSMDAIASKCKLSKKVKLSP